MQPDMVFGTVMKLTKMNQNINIGSKKVDWVRSFRFWPESVHRFLSARLGALNATRHGFRHNYETDPNEPKHHYWVHKSGLGAFVLFLDESVHRLIFGLNRCSKCNPTWFSAQ